LILSVIHAYQNILSVFHPYYVNFTDTLSDKTNWILLMDSIIPEEAFEDIIITPAFRGIWWWAKQ
jgi:hypothetical protein